MKGDDFMSNATHITHPIILSYLEGFSHKYEISAKESRDQHSLFEQYINDLVLNIYGNDPNALYEDMDTGSAFGIDGVAIFVADKLVTSIEDVDDIIEDLKKFEVNFFFTQSKTTQKFNRQEVNDFFSGVRRFFNFEKCEINELEVFWEVAKYIYTKVSKFKKRPELNLVFASLAPKDINLNDIHMKATVEQNLLGLDDLNLFSKISSPQFLGVKQIMDLQNKANSDLEISINMTKSPVAYPKDPTKKIKNGYFGLIKLADFVNILTDEVSGKRILRKGIFDDNIRYYLGAKEKVEVNHTMKEQLVGDSKHLFGVLNNGITIISDEVNLNSEELTLINYQIVNGCQTSNVIFEVLDKINLDEDIYIPARFIATNDEETKNSIIRATNSQTALKPEQLAALSPIQKALEEYYTIKRKAKEFDLYYERRTEQYRDESIQKTKIITIPSQIKATSALFLDLPHEVSGQYGKVEKKTRGMLFDEESDLSFLNVYYVSGLAWYKVERFVQNNKKKYIRARWHIIMVLKYILCKDNQIDLRINKNANTNSQVIEKALLDEEESGKYIMNAIILINEALTQNGEKIEEVLQDRKLFERKDTTSILVDYLRKSK
ncbi:AIPR family protein [Listeria rocourtiae]|nr:AIPR family protein [Listeria rocourtiae]